MHCECNCILLSALIRRTSCLSSCKYSRVIRLILKFWILPSFLCKIRKKKKAMERLKMILQPFVERKCKNIWQGCWVLRWDHSQVCESGIVFCNESLIPLLLSLPAFYHVMETSVYKVLWNIACYTLFVTGGEGQDKIKRPPKKRFVVWFECIYYTKTKNLGSFYCGWIV